MVFLMTNAPLPKPWQLRPITVPYLFDIFAQLTSGLMHAHHCRVAHRDLKSDNALVKSTVPLVVKWADFGCAVRLTGHHPAYGPAGACCRRSYYLPVSSSTLDLGCCC